MTARSLTSLIRRLWERRGQRAQLHAALESCRVPIVLVDNQRRYLDANAGARLLFRLSLAELRERRIDDLTPAFGLPRMESLWKQLMSQGEVLGDYDVRFEDASEIKIVFSALANVLPAEHLIVFAPANWSDSELDALSEGRDQRATGPLTGRENEVLTLIAEGLSISEIAAALTLSPTTVRTHVAKMYRKLGARNRAHAVALGLRAGLIANAPQPSER